MTNKQKVHYHKEKKKLCYSRVFNKNLLYLIKKRKNKTTER